MTNYPDRDADDREMRQRREVYSSENNRLPGQITPTPEATSQHQAADRDAYQRGRLSEQRLYEQTQVARDNDNAARGLLIGILFTALAAMLVGAFFLLNQRNQSPVLLQRVVPSPSPAVSPSPQVRERIIERDRLVPVPQTPPEVNITVPSAGQQVAPEAAPAPTSETAPAAVPEPAPTDAAGTGSGQ